MVWSDLAVVALSLAASFLLIPRYGAIGAALSTTGALVFQNVVNQVGLWAANTGVRTVEWRFVRPYLLIAGAVVALLASQHVLPTPAYVSAAVAAAVSLLVIRLSRRAFAIEAVFPELLRVPLVRQLLL